MNTHTHIHRRIILLSVLVDAKMCLCAANIWSTSKRRFVKCKLFLKYKTITRTVEISFIQFIWSNFEKFKQILQNLNTFEYFWNLWIRLNTFEYIWTHLNAFEYTRIYFEHFLSSKVFKCIQIYSNVFKSIQTSSKKRRERSWSFKKCTCEFPR